MPIALSIKIKVEKPNEDPAQPRYLNVPMLVLGVGVEPPAEIDGVPVPFPVEPVVAFVVLIIAEDLPLAGLVGEDDGLVPLPGRTVPVLATLDVGTVLEEGVEEGDALVPLPNEVVAVFVMLVISVELVELVGEEDVPVPLVEGMELKLPAFVGEGDVVMTVVGIELVAPVGEGVVLVPLLKGAVVSLIVGIELPEAVENDVPVSLVVGEDDVGMAVVGIELVAPVGEGVVLVPLLKGAVVPLIVGIELPEAVENDVPVPLVVGTELPESVGEEDVPVSVGVAIELPESVRDDVPVPLVVGIELPESVGEEDVPVSVGVVIELMGTDDVRVVLVVLPYGGVTEFIELPEEVELNVSEEP
jgi:hypothetical protein